MEAARPGHPDGILSRVRWAGPRHGQAIIDEALVQAHHDGRNYLTYKDWLDAADERRWLKQPIRSSNLTVRRDPAFSSGWRGRGGLPAAGPRIRRRHHAARPRAGLRPAASREADVAVRTLDRDTVMRAWPGTSSRTDSSTRCRPGRRATACRHPPPSYVGRLAMGPTKVIVPMNQARCPSAGRRRGARAARPAVRRDRAPAAREGTGDPPPGEGVDRARRAHRRRAGGGLAEVEAAHPELLDKFERRIIRFRDFAPMPPGDAGAGPRRHRRRTRASRGAGARGAACAGRAWTRTPCRPGRTDRGTETFGVSRTRRSSESCRHIPGGPPCVLVLPAPFVARPRPVGPRALVPLLLSSGLAQRPSPHDSAVGHRRVTITIRSGLSGRDVRCRPATSSGSSTATRTHRMRRGRETASTPEPRARRLVPGPAVGRRHVRLPGRTDDDAAAYRGGSWSCRAGGSGRRTGDDQPSGGSAAGGSTGGAVASSATVTIGDGFYDPTSVRIAAGGAVTFRNTGGDEHSATRPHSTPAFWAAARPPARPSGRGHVRVPVHLPFGHARHVEVVAAEPVAAARTQPVGAAPHPDTGADRRCQHRPPTRRRSSSVRRPRSRWTPPTSRSARRRSRSRPDGRVTWTNRGVAPHSVTAKDGAFDSGMLEGGATLRRPSRRPDRLRTFARSTRR